MTWATASNQPSTITFDPVVATKVKLDMVSQFPAASNGAFQIAELQVIGDEFAASSNAALSDLEVNGSTVPGFDPAKTNYTVASSVYPPVISATAADNGTVAIQQPASLPGTAIITVTSEDGTKTQTYSVYIGESATTGGVGGTVPATLALNISGPATFGTFTPGLANDYAASTTATVTSTAGDATLSVSDPDTAHPGHLVNGAFALPQALQAKASSPNGAGGAFAPLGTSPLALLTYTGPVSNDAVTIGFKQPIAATDPLRTGNYGKTLTFTLSTTTP